MGKEANIGGIGKARAAALSYGPTEDMAPKVTAAGKGFVANRIVEAAREAGVPVYDDPALAETLSRIKIGEEIPPELYEVVASVLAYIVAVDTRQGGLYTSIKNARL